MDEIEYPAVLSLIIEEIRAKTPKVTGNLTMNTHLYLFKNEATFGRIEINTPYAQFVDYGFLEHPNSKKLKKDYLYVEKSLRRVLKIVVERYGGGVVK